MQKKKKKKKKEKEIRSEKKKISAFSNLTSNSSIDKFGTSPKK